MFLALPWLTEAALASSLTLIAHDPTGRPAPVDRCDVPLCTALVEGIDRARQSVDIALYGMRNQTALLEAIERARARGVHVRAVVDRDVDGANYYSSTDLLLTRVDKVSTDLETDRRSGKIKEDITYTDACDRPLGFAGPLQCLTYDLGETCLYAAHASRDPIVFKGDIMHDKFVVVDRSWVWTGSTNASDSGTGGYNANLAVVIDSPVVAGWYTREMDQMMGGRFHSEKLPSGEMTLTLDDGSEVRALFSPQDLPITNAVRPLLQGAKERIDVAVFFLTHKEIAQDLVDAHLRGVKVRVMLDATAATNEYTKHEVLRAAGIPVKIEDFGGKLHAKSALIDGETLIAGSMNWTGAGERGNDENTLIIESKGATAVYSRWYEALWNRIDDRWLEGRPNPESRESGTACTDGVDNDFDDLADQADPGCGDNPPVLRPLPPMEIEPKPEEGCAAKGGAR